MQLATGSQGRASRIVEAESSSKEVGLTLDFDCTATPPVMRVGFRCPGVGHQRQVSSGCCSAGAMAATFLKKSKQIGTLPSKKQKPTTFDTGDKMGTS